MPKAKTKVTNKTLKGLKGKQLPWLRAYLDETNPATFLNNTASARAAGYNCSTEEGFTVIGAQNLAKLRDRINLWLEEEGLSEAYLQRKLASLIEAKKTVIQKIKGHAPENNLSPGVRQLAVTHKLAWAGTGDDAEPFDDGETLLSVDMEALETQRKTLDMAFKVKGMYEKDNKQRQLIVEVVKFGDE